MFTKLISLTTDVIDDIDDERMTSTISTRRDNAEDVYEIDYSEDIDVTDDNDDKRMTSAISRKRDNAENIDEFDNVYDADVDYLFDIYIK